MLAILLPLFRWVGLIHDEGLALLNPGYALFFPVCERSESFLEQSLICGEMGNSAHPLHKETSKETFCVKIPLVKKL